MERTPNRPVLNAVATQRCFNHALREAALRCPECKRYYCRECASEHDGRYLCAACIKAAVGERKARRNWLRPVLEALAFLIALAMVWQVFFFAGYVILQLPTPAPVPLASNAAEAPE